MQFRETLLNLAITSVLVLIVVLGGMLLREHRSETPKRSTVAPALPPEEEAKAVVTKFEVIPSPRARLVESANNEADTLRIEVGQEQHVFVLYFVDALEATMTHPQRVAEQGRYFGNASDGTVVEAGIAAAAYVTNLLKARPFQVMTRWERVSNTTRYYALIVVDMDGKKVYLADLLMQKGYARLAGVTTELVGDTRSADDYILELQQLAKQARQKKAGIWVKVAK